MNLPRGQNTGVGFGDWFEQHQAQVAKEQNGNGNGSEATGADSGSRWNNLVPTWAERTDGQSLLPNFFSGANTQKTEADSVILGLSYAQRFKGFVATLLLSAVFFVLAFFVGLPVVVLRPHKFALCFTLGSLCFMASFAMLRGPSEHIAMLCRSERLPFTALYVVSMLGTLHACLVMRSYFLVAVFSVLQGLSLAWFFVAMVPGGSGGLKYVLGAIAKTAQYTIMPCIHGCGMCFKGLFR
eukprot:TRINITY_DN9479_c0_g2_i2.p1 TRINITY_DN9479_c0_g2~~TRINITY_DN9479_c0_g2_i2.p1  ORF type:complete len:240 (-),score=27.18 TRINITY_DN9479_c0_g2_i2:222-941(-)